MLKFFICHFKTAAGQIDECARMATVLIKEIEAYFGHSENVFSIPAKLILLQKQLQDLSLKLQSAQESTDQYRIILQRAGPALLQKTKELEQLIIRMHGDKNEQLININQVLAEIDAL